MDTYSFLTDATYSLAEPLAKTSSSFLHGLPPWGFDTPDPLAAPALAPESPYGAFTTNLDSVYDDAPDYEVDPCAVFNLDNFISSPMSTSS
jgi:hypothetical protein